MNHPLPRLSAAVAAVLLASACTSATLNDTPTSASTQQSSAASSAAPGASQASASVTIDPSLRSIVRSGVPEVRYARSLGTLAVYTKGSNSAWVLYSNGGSRVAAGRWTADEAEPVRDGFLALSWAPTPRRALTSRAICT